MKAVRKFLMSGFALVAVTLLSVGFANAASSTHGRFKLPVEARCKGAVLPAGEYTYSVQYSGATTVIFVQAVDGAPSFFLFPATYSEAKPAEADELVLTKRGSETYLTSFTLPELGMVLHYSMPSGDLQAASATPAGTMVAAATK